MSIGISTAGLKADFKQDLLSVCSWFEAEPKSKEVSELLEEYRVLYRDFQKGVVAYVRKFEEDCRKKQMDGKSPKNEINRIIEENEEVLESKMDAGIEKILRTWKSDIDVVSFGMGLWTLASEHSKKKTYEDFDFDKNLSHAFRLVFYRRMCELVMVCLRRFSGRFDSSELFDKRKTGLNNKLLEDLGQLFHYEQKIDSDEFFLSVNEFLDFVKKNTRKITGVHLCREWYFNLISYSSTRDMLFLNFLNYLHKRVAALMAQKGVSKEDFLKFLKDKSTKELLEIKGGYVKQEQEADLKIRSDVEYKNLAILKDDACYALENISREFEKNRNLAKYYDDLVLRADRDLVEIALKMGSKGKYCEIKNEIEKNSVKADQYWKEAERLRPLVEQQRATLISLTDELNERYSKEYSKLSVDEKVMCCINCALACRQGDGVLRSFLYCNRLRCNIVQSFTDRVFKEMNKTEKHSRQALTKLELTDDFEEEYSLLVCGRHRSSSLDKRRSKIRMECEESALITEESLNTGFVREDKGRERGKSAGLKRTKEFDF